MTSLLVSSCPTPFTCRPRPNRGRRVVVKASGLKQNWVKICGVTNVEDAELAAATGANLIGMILYPKAKRSISATVARQIATVARRHGAQPVAVFVDEDAGIITRVCEEADVQIAQLHGNGARAAVAQLHPDLQVVYVMHAEKDGRLVTALPQQAAQQQDQLLTRQVDWILLDSLKGGSGEHFDWRQLQPPIEYCSSGWLLAGGLGPHNVAEAIEIAHPSGVDVSSGVCGPDGLKKDADRVVQFVQCAHAAFSALR